MFASDQLHLRLPLAAGLVITMSGAIGVMLISLIPSRTALPSHSAVAIWIPDVLLIMGLTVLAWSGRDRNVGREPALRTRIALLIVAVIATGLALFGYIVTTIAGLQPPGVLFVSDPLAGIMQGLLLVELSRRRLVPWWGTIIFIIARFAVYWLVVLLLLWEWFVPGDILEMVESIFAQVTFGVMRGGMLLLGISLVISARHLVSWSRATEP